MLLTAGHNIYDHGNSGKYIRSLTVSFGQDGEVRTALYGLDCVLDGYYVTNKEYRDYGTIDADYAVIVINLLGDPTGFPLSELTDEQLSGRAMEAAGYPVDKYETMWSTGGTVEEVTDGLIRYMADSYGGMSGAPIWTSVDRVNPSVWRVCGIHRAGYEQKRPPVCFNEGVRMRKVISDFIGRVRSWSSGYQFSPIYGGPHEAEFDDSTFLKITDTLTQLTLWQQDSRSIALSPYYAEIVVPPHGAETGTGETLYIGPGEYLKKIELFPDRSKLHTKDWTQIYSARFTTNRNQTIGKVPADRKIETIEAPEGWQIAGFRGRVGSHIYSLGAVYLPIITF